MPVINMMETGLEVAVIGMAGRFPGAEGVDSFWNNLRRGYESISRFSIEELLSEDSADRDAIHLPNYVPANSYLESKHYFDAAFFGYSRDEAALMDPQARLLHECVWEAIEAAGYNVYRSNS